MAAIHYNNRTIEVANNQEAAEVIAQAVVASGDRGFVNLALFREGETNGESILLGPGIPISATVDDVEQFSAAVDQLVAEYRAHGIPQRGKH